MDVKELYTYQGANINLEFDFEVRSLIIFNKGVSGHSYRSLFAYNNKDTIYNWVYPTTPTSYYTSWSVSIDKNVVYIGAVAGAKSGAHTDLIIIASDNPVFDSLSKNNLNKNMAYKILYSNTDQGISLPFDFNINNVFIFSKGISGINYNGYYSYIDGNLFDAYNDSGRTNVTGWDIGINNNNIININSVAGGNYAGHLIQLFILASE